MMTMRVRIAIVVVLVVALVAMINLIRKKSLDIRYALTWLALDIGILIIVIIPGLLDSLAEFLGIYNPVNMIFFLGFLFSLVVIFALTMSVSRNSNRVRKMAQRIALNEYRLNKKSE